MENRTLVQIKQSIVQNYTKFSSLKYSKEQFQQIEEINLKKEFIEIFLSEDIQAVDLVEIWKMNINFVIQQLASQQIPNNKQPLVDQKLSEIFYIFIYSRESILNFYETQSNSYKYDPIQLILSELKKSNNNNTNIIQQSLISLTIFLNTDFEAFKNIWDLSNLFKNPIQYLKNPELRPYYINLVLKFTQNFIKNEENLLMSCYKITNKALLESQIITDSQKITKIFQNLQQKITQKLQNQYEQNTKQQQQNGETSENNKPVKNEKRKFSENEDDESSSSEFLVCKKQLKDQEENQENKKIIITDIELKELAQLEKLILSSKFIVVNGPLSSGKTEYIEYLKEIHRNQIITLFIDYSTDLKSLLGAYVCTEKIGQFEWKDGPLVKAMEEGKWLVFKNFQEANDEIINGLQQIAQQNQYFLSSQGRNIKAHFRFKIIGVGSYGRESEQKKISLRNTVAFFEKQELSFSHLQQIIVQKYPLVFKHIKNLLFDKIKQVLVVLKKSLRQNQMFLLNVNKILALFKRINFHIQKIYGEDGIENKILTEDFRRIIYQEACDLLILNDKNALSNEKLHENLLKVFDLGTQEYEISLLKYNPQINLDSQNVEMGKLGAFSRNLYMNDNQIEAGSKFQEGNQIVYNPYSSRLLEKIASCIYFDEPCLLVGDTGCGKTTMAQHCAEIFRKTLHIYNMSQGSDAIDLIGGFKPIDVRILLKKLMVKYVKYFGKIVNMQTNKAYLDSLKQLFQTKQYIVLMKCLLDSFPGIFKKLDTKFKGSEEEKVHLKKKFSSLQKKIENIYVNKDKIESNLAFSFIEGNLIKAIKHGDWILIDEINLANNEVLQKLLPIIEGKSLVLYERGDLREIKRHPDFRILTCMNPGSDIGKKELPNNIKQKFTEIFVHDIEYYNDLLSFVSNKVKGLSDDFLAEKVVDLFQDIKKACKENLLEDGYNKRQHVSLRNLSRALNYVRSNIKIYGLERCLYDGLYLGFGTALSKASQKYFEGQIEKIIGVSTDYYNKNLLSLKPKIPSDCVELYGFHLKKGSIFGKQQPEEFLVTATFKKYIIDLLRAIAHTDLPVLLEGPTSSGKTSIVKYIASVCGYKCVRVNNHQHTDIEEYIGTYLPDNKGRLVFQEGVLIEAMKKGHWLILDELNLARSEILESLNRLLDDNKEIFINETQTYVKPHPNFRLFATQNPTTYGGRKELSKAFKNRFVQLYFDEIQEEDLELILQKRCVIAPSYCKRLMNILKDLKVFRQRSNFFLGKEGVITVRDLIKWGQREVENLEQLGMEGYCILAERLRSEEERKYIKKIIEKHLKVKLDVHKYYQEYTQQHLDPFLKDFPYYLQINESFRRMATLALKAIKQNEPVLLIGETGCGKTTVSQLIAHIRKTEMYSINCHQYTESSDFLGSLRPVRQKENQILTEFMNFVSENDPKLMELLGNQTIQIDKRIEQVKESEIIKNNAQIMAKIQEIEAALIQSETLFEWQDGPLVKAMHEGAVFLIDEISLAEDSVLERLNSVLEPTRSLLLPEKGSQDLEEICASESFLIISTMNPGGDFGKKELSPALRNRFTEIWVEPITAKAYLEIQDSIQSNDVYKMITDYLTVKKVFTQHQIEPRNALAKALFEFLRFFNLDFVVQYSLEKRSLTMRDILAIMELIVKCRQKTQLNISQLYYHSIDLVLLESIGFLMISQQEKNLIRDKLNNFLESQVKELDQFSTEETVTTNLLGIDHTFNNPTIKIEIDQAQEYGIKPFTIAKKQQLQQEQIDQALYSLGTLKVRKNLLKVMRGLQLDKSILLEGMPGVGKTSLIEYIAHKSNRKLVKISLSEQTDIVDLLGSDLPVSSSSAHQQLSIPENNENMEIEEKEEKSQQKSAGMKFKWYDGVLLDALKTGKWILLDELNLASQTILEGLNAILDHRGTVFIPEMNESFTKHPEFRIFACQNPMQIGGGRKGLPSSFLSRFTKIYFEEFEENDLKTILNDINYDGEDEILQKIIKFILQEKTGNLRDLLRFCEIYQKKSKKLKIAIEIAFLAKEKSVFRRTELQNLLQTKYLPGIYEKSVEISDNHTLIPPLFNFQDNINKSVFITNSIKQNLYSTYEILNQQKAFMISGNKGSGKNQFVKLLKNLQNIVISPEQTASEKIHQKKNLVQINLNSQVDSTELIGAYDQVDLKRQFSLLTQMLEQFLHQIIENPQVSLEIKFLSIEWLQQIEVHLNDLYLQDDLDQLHPQQPLQQQQHAFQQEKTLLVSIQKITNKLKKLNIQIDQNITNYINELKKFFQFNNNKQENIQGQFDWFFSNIIKAVQEGDWLILDNVQNANQAVLARLNPLLEKPLFSKKSKLVITECHQNEDEILEIDVHPDFKLFLLWDTSCNAPENISLSNKCTQINLDVFYNKNGGYIQDLSRFIDYKFGENNLSQDLKAKIIALDQNLTEKLPAANPLEFRSFDKFLENIWNSVFVTESDYFDLQLETCFQESYVVKLQQTKYSSKDQSQQQQIQKQQQQTEILEQSLQTFQKTAIFLLESFKNDPQLFVNLSNFPMNKEIFSHYQEKIKTALLKQADEQPEIDTNFDQNNLKEKLDLVYYLDKNGSTDPEINSLYTQCHYYLQYFTKKSDQIEQDIKLLQKQNEYKTSRSTLIEFFSSILSNQKLAIQSEKKLVKENFRQLAHTLEFLNNNIKDITKFQSLIIHHTLEKITNLQQQQQSQEIVQKNIILANEKTQLKMELWKYSLLYQELPKNKQQDFLRKLVKFLMSENISNEIMAFEQEFLTNSKTFNIQNLLNTRKLFQNVYFVEKSTRQISMEMFNFLSKTNKENSDKVEILFENFVQELNRIIGENDFFQNQELYDKQYIITIEDEFQNEILRQIPIFIDEKAIQYFSLKFKTQDDQIKNSALTTDIILSQQQKINTKQFEEFISFLAYSNTALLCLQQQQNNNKINFTQHLKEILGVLDTPDIILVKITQFLKNIKQIPVAQVAEIYVLSRIKNSQYQEIQLQDLATNILNINIKSVPFLNNLVKKVQKTLETHLKLVSDIQDYQQSLEENDENQVQYNKNVAFFDKGKSIMALNWIGSILTGVFQLEKSQIQNANNNNNVINAILDIQDLGQFEFVRENLIQMSNAFDNQHVGKIGYYILQIFGFEEILSDNLAVILKEEMNFEIKQTEFNQKSRQICANIHENEQISGNFYDFNSNRHSKKLQKLVLLKKIIEKMKEKIVYRGNKSNAEELEYFFQQNQIFISRIQEQNLQKYVEFNIEEFYQELASHRMSNLQFKDKMEEKQRELIQVVQHIDNFLQVSYTNFYLNFSDFLVPYYIGLLYVKDHLLACVRNIQQNLITRRFKRMRYQLFNKNYKEKVQNLENFVTADLQNVDVVLDEVFDTQSFIKSEKKSQIKEDHKNLFKRIMDFCEENLLKKEEIDKLKEDDAKRFIVFQKKIQNLIVDEYTEEAVEAQKREELEAIQQQFNTYANDFKSFLEMGGDMKERLERQQEDLKYQVEMENLDKKSKDNLQSYIFEAVLKILKKDNNILKKRKKNFNRYSDRSTDEFISNYSKLGLQFIQNQVVNSDFQIHDTNSVCEFLLFIKSYTQTNKFDSIMTITDVCLPTYDANGKIIKAQQQQDKTTEEEQTRVKYNVYRDAVQEETSLIYKPLNELLFKVNSLLNTDEFMYNQILQNLGILVDYMLDSNFQSIKLSKVITGIQYITEKANEWDISVPKMFGLKDQTNYLISLLLKWRMKEKSGWKVLLEDKEKEIQSKDIIMFLKLRQILLQYILENKDEKEFYSVCFQFISSSTVGTMQMRLYMLRYIAFYDLQEYKKEQKILNSISQYFSMFEEQLVEKVETECKEFDKEIEEYRRLAGWESKNYLTLKATLEKFHKKIYKICKKYKDFMQEPSRIHVFEPYRKKLLQENYQMFYQNFLQQNFQRKIFQFVQQELKQQEQKQEKKIEIEQEKQQENDIEQEEKDKKDKKEEQEQEFEIDLKNTIQEQFFTVNYQKAFPSIPESNQVLKRGLNLLNRNQLVLNEQNIQFLEDPTKKSKKKDEKKEQQQQDTLDLRVMNLLNDDSDEKQQREKQISSYIYIEELIGDVFDRVNNLKNDEASTKVMKLRAVQDLFKQLKFFGFTSFYKTSLHKDKTEVYEFENIDFSEFQQDESLIITKNILESSIKQSEKHYYEILDRISCYKTNPDFSKDLAPENIRKGGGYMIEFFYFLREMYKNTGSLIQEYNQLLKNLRQAEFIINSTEKQEKQKDILIDIDTLFFTEQLNDIKFTLQQTFQIFKENPEIKQKFQEFFSELQALRQKFDYEIQYKQKLTQKYFLNEILPVFEKLQQKIKTTLVSIKNITKIEEYILIKDQINQGVVQILEDCKEKAQKTLQDNLKTVNFEENSENNISSVQILVQNCIKSVQTYKQNLWANLEKQQDIFTDKEYLEENADKQKMPLNITNLKLNEAQFMPKLVKTLENFNKKSLDVLDFQSLQLLQIFEKYIESLVIYNAKALSSFAKFGNILSGILMNLFYKGFCHPDKDGEDGEGIEGGNSFKDGTGIGEGKGVQNVTDEMKFEEQMLGLKDEEQDQEDDIEEDMKQDQEKKDKNDFDMDQDFKGKNDQLNEDEKEEQKDKAEEQGNDEMDDVDEEQIDPKMWEGDDDKSDIDEEEGDDKKQNRKQDELEFKQKHNQEQNKEDEQLQAREKEKEKDKQRNIEDFEKDDEKTKEQKDRDLNQEEINELNKEDADFDDKDFDNLPEGEKLDDDKAKGEDLELNDEDQLEEEEGDQNLQELEQEGSEQEELDEYDDEKMGDPLDQVEESYEQKPEDKKDEEEDLEKYPDQVEKQQNSDGEDEEEEQEKEQGNEAMDEEEDEDKKDPDQKKKRPNQEQKKKKEDKRFGVTQDDDKEMNDEVNQDDQMEVEKQDDKKQEDAPEGNEGGEVQEEQDNNNNSSDDKFSQDFLKQIEQTKEAFDRNNFVKDLKVVEENEEQQENDQGVNPENIDENQEFEAIEFEKMEEVQNMVSTNIKKDQTSKNEEQAKKQELEDNNEENKNQEKNQEDREKLQKELEENLQKEKKQKLEKNKQQQQNKQNNKNEMEEEKPEEVKPEDKIDYKSDIKTLEEQQRNHLEQLNLESNNLPEKMDEEKEEKDENKDNEEDDEEGLNPYDIEKVDQNACKQQVQDLLKDFRENSKAQQQGMQLWQKMEQETRYYSMQLAEELKVILEPQQIQNFKGDYKSGKRLNMKKIINYIASNFRKNKIWLRRNAPSKRTYQILLGIDDSYSMQEQNVGYLALQSLTTVSLAMSKMEVGDMAIAAIHEYFKLVHPLEKPLTPADVPFILSQFKFDYQDVHSSDLSIPNFMRGAIDMFTEVKQRDSQQICFIISDGRFNKKMVKALCSEGEENNILFVFIILDNKKDEKQSIMNIKSANQTYVDGKLKIKMTHYLSDFPYKYYIVCQDVFELSKVLVDILRQYFEIERI